MTGNDSTRAASYALTPAQRKLLEGSASPGRDPGVKFSRIREQKVNRLPERLDHLIDDVDLLAEAGFFEPGWDGELWERIQTENEAWSEWSWAEHWSRLLTIPLERANLPAAILSYTSEAGKRRRFGAALGRLVRLLSAPEVTPEERLDIVMGFIRGATLPGGMDRYKDPTEPSHAQYFEVLDELAERGERILSEEEHRSFAFANIWKILDHFKETVRDELAAHDVTLTQPVFDAVDERAGVKLSLRTIIESSDVPSREAIVAATEEVVAEHHLDAVETLAWRSIRDLQTLKTRTLLGIPPMELLREVASWDQPQPRDELSFSTNLAGQVEKALWWLTNPISDRGPLLKKPLTRQVGDNWTTTAYGDVVVACDREHYDIIGGSEGYEIILWYHRVALDDEAIDERDKTLVARALDELNMVK